MDGWVDAIANGVVPPRNLNMNATEDCLLLDVHVPKKVLDAAQRKKKGAPVLVFIHGGGGVFGSKDGSGPTRFEPSGILQQSRDKFGEDFVFVAINYRLGAFGFLAGSEVQRDGNANAGLLDQRFALQWVQNYIHLFGGSKDHVTVMGESGGGGSILLHMAAAAATQRNHTCGQEAKLFQQAILQSPALRSATRDPNEIFNEFLSFLDVKSLEEARRLPSSAVIVGNSAQIQAAPPTDFLYGPVVDGDYVSAPLLQSLRDGAVDKTVKVFAGHNVFEGAFFFDPAVKAEEDFRDWLEVSIPGLEDSRFDDIAKRIYPAVYDGSVGYVDTNTRQMSVWGEAVIDCAYHAISKATKTVSYACKYQKEKIGNEK
ncbi:hypothetical protein PLICBS_004121 [Purpureocillium lilacinum]|uniref:uncharacterized protein n=1 Tax=Purpureocillium lilacinum TaxID=33203 RepID=UPI00207F6E23|nr:hypothetical protein PLICBS_004121 [Purpureocillium lilacinum]